jgi:hypothetical protein
VEERSAGEAANGKIRVRVKVYGLLIAVVDSPDRLLDLTLPNGTDVKGAVEALQETSSLFDPRSCLAVIDGVKVASSDVLNDGDEVHLYHVFSGG